MSRLGIASEAIDERAQKKEALRQLQEEGPSPETPYQEQVMKATTKKKTKVNLQALINWLYTELLGVNKQVEDDLAKAAKDMHKFLTWGDNACEHAAKQKWLAIYLEVAKTCLKNDKTPEGFLEYISDNLMNESSISINSGGMHGKMETCDRSTKARLIHEMKQALKYNTFL